MPCLQKNGAVTPQYRQRLCPPGQGHFFHAVLAHSGRAPVSKTTGRWFESTRMKTKTFCKQKTASVSLRWRAFYGRGWITQAAHLKKPRRGFFPRRTIRRVDAVRIRPPSLREGYYKTETPVPGLICTPNTGHPVLGVFLCDTAMSTKRCVLKCTGKGNGQKHQKA